uniref:Uncharacterized protein n=1 Tax=Ditylenchus dipsaci TaxID=166011 RepID=A0A915DSF9_9BILA
MAILDGEVDTFAFTDKVKKYRRSSFRKQDGSFLFPDGSHESAFVAYFVKTWIGVTSRGARPLFAADLWNC